VVDEKREERDGINQEVKNGGREEREEEKVEENQKEQKVEENQKEEEDGEKPQKISRTDFFSQLLVQEGMKGRSGTVHAVGRKVNMSSTLKGEEESEKWECGKCGHKNPKYTNECTSCRAIKRMSEWR